MTELRIFHGAARPEAFLYNLLLRKLLPEYQSIMLVTADARASAALNDRLWTVEDTGFLPHCLATEKRADRTPVVIAEADTADQHKVRDVVVSTVPAFPDCARSAQHYVAVLDGAIDHYADFRGELDALAERGFSVKYLDLVKPGR